MNTYYYIKLSSNPKKIGSRFPQISDYIDNNYNFLGDNSIWKIDYSKKIDFNLELPIFKLYHKAKLTDLISCSNVRTGSSMLVSARTAEILNNYNLCKYQVFPAKIFHKSSIYPYYFLYFYENTNELINFNSSEFYTRPWTGVDIKKSPITISSIDDLNEKINHFTSEKQFLLASKLIFRFQFTNYDLFRTHGIFNAFYISSRVFQKLEKEGITGLDYFPFEDGEFEINQKLI
ncbi:MAG: hypothetical protein KDC85_22915 [Saprospiraceae bacterium]|nr:hypothetical protein [Saprospiraceae bacterium]